MIFKIVDRKISVESEVVLSYSLDYVATFEFDEEWNNKIVTARFVHENGNMVEVVLDSENSCNIPLFPKGVVNVGVYTDEFTSTYAPMRIYTSIKDIGEYEVIPPTADVYQQIISLIEEGRIKGEDGFSPTVVIEDIEGGHTVVITDAEGDKEFDVMDGSDYTITESDYAAIAERTKDLVPTYDDTEVRAELNGIDDRLDALWKMNEGQTYDVYESESEDYTKAIPSGAYWGSLDMVGGKSVVWNQLGRRYNGTETNGGVTAVTVDNVMTVNGTASEVVYFNNSMPVISNHKYLFKSLTQTGSYSTIRAYMTGSVTAVGGDGIDYVKGCIYTATSTATSYLVWAWINSGVDVSNLICKPMVVDLTKMFGAGNEPTSVDDARIKMIEQYAEEHPQYNEGEIISSEVDAVVVAKADIIQIIPTNFPILRSAGNVYDYIDIDKGELHRRVGVVDDISTLNFNVVPYYSELTGNSVFAIKMPRDSKGYNSWATCEAMCVDSVAKPYNAKDLYVLWNNTSQNDLTVAFPNGTTMQNVIEHYSGMPLYYELAEEIVTPIELPTELTEWLEVEPNGSITFANDGKLLVPNTERFVRKLNEV